MEIRRYILVLAILLGFGINSCQLSKGIDAIEIYNYFKAKEIFEKKIKRDPVAANFGLSLIYQRNDNPFYNLDSAYKSIMYAVDYFDSLSPRRKEKYAKIGVDRSVIVSQQKLITSNLYSRAIEYNTESGFSDFINLNKTSELVPLAILKRDSLAFRKARSINTAKAYETFINKYPNSIFTEDATARFDHQTFNEHTIDDQLKSYIEFIRKYPDNPFVPDAEDQIYNIETKDNSVIGYELFIKRHPDNRNIRKAWRKLYDAFLTENLDKTAIASFIDKYPDNPFRDQVKSDLELSKTYFYPVQKDGKWSFKSEKGKYLIDASFDFVEPFSEELAAVTLNGKVGYITKTGYQKIEFKYDDGLPFSEGCAIVEVNEKYGMINRQGDYIITPDYEYLGKLKNRLIPFEKDNLFGYFDQKGRVKIKAIFEKAYNFQDGVAKISINNNTGLINTDGQYIFEPIYTSIQELDTHTYGLNKNNQWGVLNINGDTILNFLYDDISGPTKGYYLVTRNDSFNYVNSNRELLLSNWYPVYPEYKILAQYDGMPILVFNDNGYNYIRPNGESIFKKDKLSLGRYSQLIAYEENEGKWGYLQPTPPKVIIKPTFDQAKSFENGFGMVSQGPLFGLVDSLGSNRLDAYYEDIEFINDSLLLVRGKGNFGIMNIKGDTVLLFSRNNIEPFSQNTVKVSNSNSVSYYNYKEDKWIRKEE